MEEQNYHILLCESSVVSLEINKRYVELFSAELHRNLEIHSYSVINEELNIILQCGERIDMVISDVRLHEENGISLVKKIQHKKPAIPVIFITNQGRHCEEADSLMPIGLLERPIEPEKFRVLYRRAIAQIELESRHEKNSFLEFQVNKKNIRLKTKTIISLEKRQKKVIIRTDSDIYEVRDTLTMMEQRLPSDFLRISQSVIVNMNEVICIEGNQVFTSAHEDFIIGRTYQKRVEVCYRRYWK